MKRMDTITAIQNFKRDAVHLHDCMVAGNDLTEWEGSMVEAIEDFLKKADENRSKLAPEDMEKTIQDVRSEMAEERRRLGISLTIVFTDLLTAYTDLLLHSLDDDDEKEVVKEEVEKKWENRFKVAAKTSKSAK